MNNKSIEKIPNKINKYKYHQNDSKHIFLWNDKLFETIFVWRFKKSFVIISSSFFFYKSKTFNRMFFLSFTYFRNILQTLMFGRRKSIWNNINNIFLIVSIFIQLYCKILCQSNKIIAMKLRFGFKSNVPKQHKTYDNHVS